MITNVKDHFIVIIDNIKIVNNPFKIISDFVSIC